MVVVFAAPRLARTLVRVLIFAKMLDLESLKQHRVLDKRELDAQRIKHVHS